MKNLLDSKQHSRMQLKAYTRLLNSTSINSGFRWVVVLVSLFVFSALETNPKIVCGFRFGYVTNGTRRIASWFGGFVLRHNAATTAVDGVSIRPIANSSNNKQDDDRQPQQNRSSRCNNQSSNTVALEQQEEVSTASTPEDPSNSNSTNECTATLLTFHNPSLGSNTTLYGLNLSTTKFLIWVQYKLNLTFENATALSVFAVKQNIQFDQPGMRDKLRSLWKQGILLSDRTEPLATYVSDSEKQATNTAAANPNQEEINHGKDARTKRGGFRDLLSLYADRLASIVHDEYKDSSTANNSTKGLYQWMEQEYGIAHLSNLSLLPSPKNPVTEEQQMQVRHFIPL